MAPHMFASLTLLAGTGPVHTCCSFDSPSVSSMPLRPPPVAPASPVHHCPTSGVTPRLLPPDFWQRVHPRFRNPGHPAVTSRPLTPMAPMTFSLTTMGMAHPFNRGWHPASEDRGPVIRHQGLLKHLAETLAVDGSLGLLDGDLDTTNPVSRPHVGGGQIPAVV